MTYERRDKRHCRFRLCYEQSDVIWEIFSLFLFPFLFLSLSFSLIGYVIWTSNYAKEFRDDIV